MEARLLVPVGLGGVSHVLSAVNPRRGGARTEARRHEGRDAGALPAGGGEEAPRDGFDTVDAYVAAAELEEPKVALSRPSTLRARWLTGRALDRRLVLAMLKRRTAAPSTCCHLGCPVGAPRPAAGPRG